MDESNPVVTAKPKRTREMRSTVVPQEMLNTMQLVSAKKTLRGDNIDATPLLLKENKTGGAEIYHEGYVDGKRYLVPDSNLEAMKDIINLKMRPRRSTRYKHQTSYDLPTYDHFKAKVSKIISKIDQASPSISEEEHTTNKQDNTKSISTDKSDVSRRTQSSVSASTQSSQPKQDSKRVAKPDSFTSTDGSSKSTQSSQPKHDSKRVPKPDSFTSTDASSKGSSKTTTDYEKEEDQKSNEKGESDIIKDVESVESKVSESSSKATFHKDESPDKTIEPVLYESSDSNKCQVRFLISGHFKSNNKPLYIIQEYSGNHSIFENEKTAFAALQKEGNVDIFISGKMYEENILEESNGKPIFLNTKPDKIYIDEKKSKIFYDYFEDIFHMKSTDITVKGEFIKNEITEKLTPFLSFGIKQKKDS